MICPSLSVKTCELNFPTPSGAKVVVKEGDMVRPGTVLAEIVENFKEVDLAAHLKTSPTQLVGCLVVALGSETKQGDILARKKSLLTSENVKSPVDGKVENLTKEGILRIRVGERSESKSPIKGLVKKEYPESLLLEFEAVVLQAQVGSGGTCWGEIFIWRDQESALVAPPPLSGKILCLRGKIPSTLAYKAEAMGAVGIVGGAFGGEVNLVDLIILLAGDEDGLISPDIWDKLEKRDGQKALISGEEKNLKIPV